jgi:copper oxidase (laccase) domain-containing protein
MRYRSEQFFSTRAEGEDFSAEGTAWRYGRGNVFDPGANPFEATNAAANTAHILAAHMPSKARSVMLASQYGSGIAVVDADFLSAGDENIVFKGDGLFTQLPHIALLNKSGDAHAVIFESPRAAGILVGSWRCIKDGIFAKMVEKFLEQGIPPEEITVRVGPGLGSESYSVGEAVYHELMTMSGVSAAVFCPKPPKPDKPPKYVLDFPQLIQQAAAIFGIKQVDISESASTFDKRAWKAVKATATTAEELQADYASLKFFSARRHARTERQIIRVCEASGTEPPSGVSAKADYSRTGRCLNGVMLSEAEAEAYSSLTLGAS